MDKKRNIGNCQWFLLPSPAEDEVGLEIDFPESEKEVHTPQGTDNSR